MRGTELAPFIDQSVLRPDTRAAELDRACELALIWRFRGLVVPTGSVHHARRRLAGSSVKVVAVVGFPHGNTAPDVKAHEAGRAIALGADEVDYVVSIGAALDDDLKAIRDEAVAVQRQARGRILKAIVETGYLDDRRKVDVARALAETGIPYVKTCTGFGPGEATPHDVALLVQAVAGKALVKASGGIRDRARAIELLQAGAAVLGTSRGPEICSD